MVWIEWRGAITISPTSFTSTRMCPHSAYCHNVVEASKVCRTGRCMRLHRAVIEVLLYVDQDNNYANSQQCHMCASDALDHVGHAPGRNVLL
jgi:hypothetical protein